SRICLASPRAARSSRFPYTTLFRSPRRGIKTSARPRRDLGEESKPRRDLGETSARNQNLGETSARPRRGIRSSARPRRDLGEERSEEHTSELQSRENLVCRLLLEKK